MNYLGCGHDETSRSNKHNSYCPETYQGFSYNLRSVIIQQSSETSDHGTIIDLKKHRNKALRKDYSIKKRGNDFLFDIDYLFIEEPWNIFNPVHPHGLARLATKIPESLNHSHLFYHSYIEILKSTPKKNAINQKKTFNGKSLRYQGEQGKYF